MTSRICSSDKLKHVLTTVLNGSVEDIEQTIAEYFSPHYVQTTDGHESDHAHFREHLLKLRSILRSAQVEVLFFVSDGSKIADRHVVTVEKLNGNRMAIEVLLFGHCDGDGRLVEVWETTRQVDGNEDGSNLGRI